LSTEPFSTTKSIFEMDMILDRKLNHRASVRNPLYGRSPGIVNYLNYLTWLNNTRVVKKLRPIWFGDNVHPIMLEVEVRESYNDGKPRRRTQSVAF